MARLSWPGWLVIYWDRCSGTGDWTPDTVTHPSTNRGQCRLTLLIGTNVITTMPNCQLCTVIMTLMSTVPTGRLATAVCVSISTVIITLMWTVPTGRLATAVCVSISFLVFFLFFSAHADRHAADISFTVCLFVCLLVRKFICIGYLQCGLMQGDEIWQDGRLGWVAGHLPFWWTLAQVLAPRPKSEKLIMQVWQTGRWRDGDRHVGMYASADNWCTCLLRAWLSILVQSTTCLRNDLHYVWGGTLTLLIHLRAHCFSTTSSSVMITSLWLCNDNNDNTTDSKLTIVNRHTGQIKLHRDNKKHELTLTTQNWPFALFLFPAENDGMLYMPKQTEIQIHGHNSTLVNTQIKTGKLQLYTQLAQLWLTDRATAYVRQVHCAVVECSRTVKMHKICCMILARQEKQIQNMSNKTFIYIGLCQRQRFFS